MTEDYNGEPLLPFKGMGIAFTQLGLETVLRIIKWKDSMSYRRPHFPVAWRERKEEELFGLAKPAQGWG